MISKTILIMYSLFNKINNSINMSGHICVYLICMSINFIYYTHILEKRHALVGEEPFSISFKVLLAGLKN